MKHVLTVDFESNDNEGTWIAVAAGVFEYPSGRVCMKFESAVQRPLETFDLDRRVFWENKHPLAYQWIVQHSSALSQETTIERELCRFIRDAHNSYPRLQLISDNPAFDLKLLDAMLLKYNLPISSKRANMRWHHPICTYSYELPVQQWIGSRDVDGMHRAMFGHSKRMVDSEIGRAPLHTPWEDVVRLVSRHFRVLDIMHNFSTPHFQFQEKKNGRQ